MLLVASDYPLDDTRANGLENFICAVEFILQNIQVGVFVPYRNQQQRTQVHKGARLACSLQLSGDFFSVQGKSFMQFENRQFSLLNPSTKTGLRENSKKLTLPLERPALKGVEGVEVRRITETKTPRIKANFSERILMIKPYPGLNYAHFNLENVDAVLHDLYHSGTACVSTQWGENYSLLEFIKRCGEQDIKVYMAPAIKSTDAYQSTGINRAGCRNDLEHVD